MVHETDTDTLRKRLQPPAEAKTSVVLNSIGNGVMLGTAPFVISKTMEGLCKSWRTPFWLHVVDAVAIVGGTLWGYNNGQKEFKRLQDYRQTVSNEILKLNDHITANDTEIKSWADKVKKPAPQAEHAESIAR